MDIRGRPFYCRNRSSAGVDGHPSARHRHHHHRPSARPCTSAVQSPPVTAPVYGTPDTQHPSPSYSLFSSLPTRVPGSRPDSDRTPSYSGSPPVFPHTGPVGPGSPVVPLVTGAKPQTPRYSCYYGPEVGPRDPPGSLELFHGDPRPTSATRPPTSSGTLRRRGSSTTPTRTETTEGES